MVKHTRVLDKEKIADLYASGSTTEEIGKLFDVTAPTIRRFMRRHNIEIINSRSLLTKEQKQEASDMRASGMTLKQIAAFFNVGYTCIYNNLTKEKKKKVIPSEVLIDSNDIGYNPKQFKRKLTQVNEELNLYIPEKWKR